MLREVWEQKLRVTEDVEQLVRAKMLLLFHPLTNFEITKYYIKMNSNLMVFVQKIIYVRYVYITNLDEYKSVESHWVVS